MAKQYLRASLVLLLVAACGGGTPTTIGGDGDGDGDGDSPVAGSPIVTYMVNGNVYQVAPTVGATPFNVSNRLNALSSGNDSKPAASKNGAFLTISTTRFGCVDECLTVIDGDVTTGDVIEAGGGTIIADGRGAVSNDGNVVVYPANDGPHAQDLFVVKRVAGVWTTPVLLTGSSSEAYSDVPVLSADASHVLFDCGPVPYGQNGTDVCEIAVNGTGFVKRVNSDANPLGGGAVEVFAHHADYAPNGDIVFESAWSGAEQIWAQNTMGALRRLEDSKSNDNSPCVFGGGDVASLWLGRPGGQNFHELKVLDLPAATSEVVTPDVRFLTSVSAAPGIEGTFPGAGWWSKK